MTTSETIENHYGEAHAHLSDDELLAEMEHIGAVLEEYSRISEIIGCHSVLRIWAMYAARAIPRSLILTIGIVCIVPPPNIVVIRESLAGQSATMSPEDGPGIDGPSRRRPSRRL